MEVEKSILDPIHLLIHAVNSLLVDLSKTILKYYSIDKILMLRNLQTSHANNEKTYNNFVLFVDNIKIVEIYLILFKFFVKKTLWIRGFISGLTGQRNLLLKKEFYNLDVNFVIDIP